MFKVVVKLNVFLIGILTLGAILPLFVVQIWIQVSSNTRIAGNKNIPLLHVELKNKNVLNTIGLIRLNITVTLPSIAKQTSKSICYNSKQNKENLAFICLNTWTTKTNTKQIQINVYSRGIDSTKNGI